ncbi:hypothetical protein MYX77_01080 [Acidobacteriia bacterium AH_259_A11_L15]|nr:hypothetical protein [Acidobacteriia bacterium AH_259_A11_L15]
MEKQVRLVDDDLFRLYVKDQDGSYSVHINTWVREDWREIARALGKSGQPVKDKSRCCWHFRGGSDPSIEIDVGEGEYELFGEQGRQWRTYMTLDKWGIKPVQLSAEVRSLVREYKTITKRLRHYDFVRSKNVVGRIEQNLPLMRNKMEQLTQACIDNYYEPFTGIRPRRLT